MCAVEEMREESKRRTLTRSSSSCLAFSNASFFLRFASFASRFASLARIFSAFIIALAIAPAPDGSPGDAP